MVNLEGSWMDKTGVPVFGDGSDSCLQWETRKTIMARTVTKPGTLAATIPGITVVKMGLFWVATPVLLLKILVVNGQWQKVRMVCAYTLYCC